MLYLRVCIFVIFSLTTLHHLSFAESWQGKVVGISDGDTITVLRNREPVKIRLYGIDTPENGQPFGKKATRQIKNFVSRKTVEITEYDIDKYGRSVSTVQVGKLNVNRAMIEAGYAWQYRKYCKESFCQEWLHLEEAARKARIGLWSDEKALPPWKWRKQQREVPNDVTVGGTYHGNRKTHAVHSSQCKYFNCKNCTVPFASLSEAVAAGYRPHSKCISK